MANPRFNKQVAQSRGMKVGGRVKRMGGGMSTRRRDMKSGYYPDDMGMKGGPMMKKGGRVGKMGGGMMMKRPMMKEGGKLKMVMKGGKKVPFFAADGKGAKDLGKAAMKKGGLAKLNPGLKAFMKKKMAKKK